MFMIVLVVLLSSVILGLWLLYQREDRGRRSHLASLPIQDFTVTHLLEGGSHYVAFDPERRRVAFATVKGAESFSFDEMAEIQWRWNDRNGNRTGNFLYFRTHNIARPLIKVRCTSERQAEHWHAKVQALWATQR